MKRLAVSTVLAAVVFGLAGAYFLPSMVHAGIEHEGFFEADPTGGIIMAGTSSTPTRTCPYIWLAALLGAVFGMTFVAGSIFLIPKLRRVMSFAPGKNTHL